jgi:hypothetical protein
VEQKSDVEYRAEKLYKNAREKFGFIIREVVSNAIHATIIRMGKSTPTKYIPTVDVTITTQEKNSEIVVHDNGEGFNTLNRKYFTHLDFRNIEKERLHFHPQGQGRLAIIYFSDYATFSSVFQDSFVGYKSKSFIYPEGSLPLFDIEDIEGDETEDKDSYTTLTLEFTKQQTVKRANTFFSKYHDKESLKNWFIDNFFPFFMENDSLNLNINYNGEHITLNRKYIEENVESVPFEVEFNDLEKKFEFKVWMIRAEDALKSKNQLLCFARHLKAELDNGKLEYEIDLPEPYKWLITSEYFDICVDSKGDKIEVTQEDVDKIQLKLTTALNERFKDQIEKNREKTKKNMIDVKEKYHSLAPFIEEERTNGTKVMEESDIVNTAIENKGRIEKSYWSNQNSETEETNKLLNSSLHIYVDHRNRVLNKFHEYIKRFDENGSQKNEPEDDIHDLFLKRGQSLKHSSEINHLHNLWILDDKYTIFSETERAVSTKKGQELSDIYLWIDDPEQVRELLILELKSPSKAHNAGDKYESMVAQVKRYATKFYKDPIKTLNWDVEPNNILYSGFILARKSDINKELNSNNTSGMPQKIPFLDSSYFFNEQFSIGSNSVATPVFKEIRIEMYSYEDIYKLSSNRNKVFFKLLKGEYRVNTEI